MENLRNLNKLQTRTLLKRGEKGTFQTLGKIKQIINIDYTNPEVREFAIKIINSSGITGTRDHQYLNEAIAIGQYVKNNYRYVRDPIRNEFLIPASHAIKEIETGYFRGDCEDMTMLVASLLMSIGCIPYLTIVKYDKNVKGFQHIYLTLEERNVPQKPKKLVIDAIARDKSINFEPKSQVKKHMKIIG